MGIDEAIVIVPYDERWPLIFEQEKTILRECLGSVCAEIQHFGSTSVPGMLAKPIVDILVGVDSLELDKQLVENLERLGYEGFGEAGINGRLYFRKRSENSFNLVIVIWNGEQWINNLLVRDYLRVNTQAATEYSSRKVNAINKGAITLLSYSDEKSDYVYGLLQKAKN